MGEILRSGPITAKVNSELKMEDARSHMSVRMTIKAAESNLEILLDTDCINYISSDWGRKED